MKAKFTLVVISLLVLTSAAFTQNPKDVPVLGQERDFLAPPIDREYIADGHIKQVSIQEVSSAYRPTGDEELLQFDDKGRLEGLIRIKQQDTSEIHAFGYSPSGNLCREVRENRQWRKCVQRNYRLNRDATFLQGKSYEIQGDEAVMLLDTRRYQYKDGLLSKIYILTQGDVSQVHHFSYDDYRRLSQERTESADGTLLHTVDYSYTASGQLAEVLRVDHMRGKRSETFRYTYGTDGHLASAQWLQNQKLKTTFFYKYDKTDQLAEIRYESRQGIRRIRGRQLINYKAYTQEELEALWEVQEAQARVRARR